MKDKSVESDAPGSNEDTTNENVFKEEVTLTDHLNKVLLSAFLKHINKSMTEVQGGMSSDTMIIKSGEQSSEE